MSGLPCLILAGGQSSRMGENKALLPFGKGRLIDHVAERIRAACEPLLLSTNSPLPGLDGIARIADDLPGYQGPLAGIATGLAHVRSLHPGKTHMLTIAADTPFFPVDLGARLVESITEPGEIAVAADSDGRWHPVFSLWPLSVEEDLRAYLADPDNRRLQAFIRRHPHRVVTFPLIETAEGAIDPFFNVNTPAEYRQAIALRDKIA